VSSELANAAANRIAGVVQTPAASGSITSALDFVHRALEDDLSKDLVDVDINAMFFWYGDDHAGVLRFVSFAGLVELAVRSRYLSLYEWEGAEMLEQALRQFRSVNERSTSVDLSLAYALLGRFDATRSGSWSLDDVAAGTFESYLTLTSRIRRDDAVRRFLERGHGKTVVAGDLSALVSPYVFAEAFGTGEVDGVPVTDVAAGYRLLQYLEWFADILESLSPKDSIRSGIVRHARWAANAEHIRDRVRLWISHMREWEEGDRAWRDERWTEYESRVFGTLLDEQRRIAATSEAEQQPTVAPTSRKEGEVRDATALAEQIEELLSQGKRQAARALALENARAATEREPTLGHAAWAIWAEELIALCQTLAQLGGESAAAALVAPIMPRLLEKHGRSGWQFVADAKALIDGARRGPAVARATEPPEQQGHRERETRAAEQEPEQERYRSLGESS
jgi:hypothetical protein